MQDKGLDECIKSSAELRRAILADRRGAVLAEQRRDGGVAAASTEGEGQWFVVKLAGRRLPEEVNSHLAGLGHEVHSVSVDGYTIFKSRNIKRNSLAIEETPGVGKILVGAPHDDDPDFAAISEDKIKDIIVKPRPAVVSRLTPRQQAKRRAKGKKHVPARLRGAA